MIVVDTCVLIAALSGSESAQEALVGHRLLAPEGVDGEVLHALRGLVIGGKLRAGDAESMLAAWSELVVDRVPAAGLIDRAWELRENLTACDALFVAAAEAFDVPLVTIDARITRADGPRCVIQLLPVPPDR